jgi:cyclophilin family peptidyl-prolyl cis-trans isomerase
MPSDYAGFLSIQTRLTTIIGDQMVVCLFLPPKNQRIMKNINLFQLVFLVTWGMLIQGCTGTTTENSETKEEVVTPDTLSAEDTSSEEPETTNKDTLNQTMESLNDGLYAKMHTTMGEILIQLEFEKVPLTVANFVGLAEGSIANNFRSKGVPFYDGLIFHRIIKDFMVQGGDPTGTGMGDPGYKFRDEFHPELRHDRPGVLSMANSGPSSNGSQFFITHVPTPWLDGRHSVFGFVVEGQDVIDAMGDVEKGPQDKPLTPVVLKEVEIIRVGEKAESFDAAKTFNTLK